MSKKILVVDDEKEVTMTLQGFFSALGHEMVTALDGSEALKIIDNDSPALILLDLRMPGINGIQILKKVRKEKPNIKVIVITAFGKEAKEEVEGIGIDGFFEKPIDLSSLIDRISYVLQAKESTLVYPTAPQEKESQVTPKAKLLFVEPNPMVYGFTCALFNVKDFVKGEYEIKVVYHAKEASEALFGYQPDIIIMYDSMMNSNDVKEYCKMLMNSTHRPKTLILHGLIPKSEIEVFELEKSGIKFCNQNSIDDEALRLTNMKLVNFVGRECVRQGLVK